MDKDLEGAKKGDLKFPKKERLHHRSLVEGLFRSGKSFYEFPFRITWRILSPLELQKNFRDTMPENIGPLQMMVTVPKKKRRHAIDRVQMRRRIREAYRLKRVDLRKKMEEDPDIGTLSLSLIYIHDKNLPYKIIEEKIINILERLDKKSGSLTSETTKN